jgi:uncharacterized protein YndB with AHSA1/START domain
MTTSIHQEVVLNASSSKVYEALTDSQQFSTVTGGAPTEISPVVGGSLLFLEDILKEDILN